MKQKKSIHSNSGLLRVFSVEKVARLSTHPSLSANSEVKDRAQFLQIITDMWTIFNVRSLKKRHPSREPTRSSDQIPTRSFGLPTRFPSWEGKQNRRYLSVAKRIS